MQNRNRNNYASTTRILLAGLFLVGCALDPKQAAPLIRRESNTSELTVDLNSVEISYSDNVQNQLNSYSVPQNTPFIKAYENYKKEQVIAAAEWWINAMQQEIPRISSIREAHSNGKSFLAKQLLENVLVYGDNVDRPFTKIPEDKQVKFKQKFIEEVWQICQFDHVQNMMDYIHVSSIPGEGSQDIQKALLSALKAASIPTNLFEDTYLGCYVMKNGKVDAYVYTGGYDYPPLRKDIYDYNLKPAYLRK